MAEQGYGLVRLRKQFDIIYHTLFVSYGNTWGGESADDPPERRTMETKLWEHALAVNLNLAKRHCQKMHSITFRGISPCDVCEIKKICIGIDRGIKSGKVDGVSKSLLSMKDIEIPKTDMPVKR